MIYHCLNNIKIIIFVEINIFLIMKKLYILLFLFATFMTSLAQWSPSQKGKDGASDEYYTLDFHRLKSQLREAQETGQSAKPVKITVPVLGEGLQTFNVYSAPVVVKELADKYELGSYVGVAENDKSKYIRFSLAPNNFQSMIVINGQYQFIQPYDKSKSLYRVHYKTKETHGQPFVCTTEEPVANKKSMQALFDKGAHFSNQPTNFAKNSDQKFRTLRLVISVTGEYTQYHGGTVAGALAAINATMTRVNGVFEKDFALRLILQNYPNVIYTNGATDPYSPSNQMNNWNVQLQQTLTANVGNANYDIGHLFGASGGGGNAGCIGCICVNPTGANDTEKGSAYTSPANGQPEGDLFDIDYVAHEMGHQLGGNHTFAHQLEGTGVNMEPGSGSTIMGYAGITGPMTDVQPNSDPYFHIASLEQIQANLIDKTCDIEVDIANTPPTIPTLPTYTIPKGTAFVLSTDVTDAENDPMTFTWEEADNASVTINKNNLGTTTTGASFRSKLPTQTGNTRYFPEFSTVLAGVLDNSNNNWESVSMVPRQSRFALVVRDNHNVVDQQQTAYGLQIINVGDEGPFQILSENVYNNSAQSIIWDVVQTNQAPYNVANVKIDYSTNNGTSWTTIVESTPNDGEYAHQFTQATGSQVIVRVSAIDNVFYTLKKLNIEQAQPCVTTPATGIQVSDIGVNQATVTWDLIASGSYVLRYRQVGTATWTTVPLSVYVNVLTGLTEGTTYEVQVAYVCSGTTGEFSSSVEFTTLNVTYCDSSGNPEDEFISNVIVTPNGNPVMTSNSTGTAYTDYTADQSRLVKLNIGSTGNQISVAKSWSGQQYNEGVSAWIDFNRNGVFETSERILTTTQPNNVTPVTATFDVPANAYNGTEYTRMRVILQFNANPNACGSYEYGETEDYAVQLIDNNFVCPTDVPTDLAVTNVTMNSANVSWTPIAGTTSVIRYREVGTTAWTEVQVANNSTTLTGLNAATQYEVQIATFCQNTTGTFSASVNFTTLSCPTDIPTNLAVNNITSTSAVASWTPVPGTTSMLRYRKVGTAAWIEVPVAGNSHLIPALTPGVEYEVQVANVCGGNTGNYSASVNFTTSSFTWCDVSSNNSNDEWIGNVTVTPVGNPVMSNDSGASNYTNYFNDTDKLINLTIGSIGNQLSVGKAWSGTSFSENVKVWIDFNRNGVFQDDEVIMISPGSNNTPVTSTFNVPTTAYTGGETTRMRVMLKFGDIAPNPCEGYTYGEVEDYAVKLNMPESCTVNSPMGLGISNITATTAVVNWLSYVGSLYHLRYREMGTNNWITLNDLASNVYQLTNLTESTTYEVQVANTCNGIMGDFGASVEFTTLPIEWCDASSNNGSDEWITNVTINPSESPAVPMSNDSGPSQYSNFFDDDDKLVTITVGSIGNEISVSKGWGGFNSSENVTAWIDFNRNGIFEDSEKIFQSPGSPQTPVTGLFDVPNDAYVGPLKTKMRVMLKFSTSYPDGPCSNYTYGEVEDYAVLIKPGIPCSLDAPQNVNVQNVTDVSAEVSWTQDPGGATYKLRYKAVNETAWTEVMLMTNTYVINSLIPVTEYQVEIIPLCGTQQEGTPVQTTFETKCNPANPTSLMVTQITGTTAHVSWDAVPNIGSNAVYKFAYREVGAVNWTEEDVNVPTTTYDLTGLTPNTNYEVRVATECSGSINTYTNTVVFTTSPTCEMAPTGLTVTNISTTQAQVDWDAYETNAYVLRWRPLGNNPWITVELTQNTYIIQGLQEQTQYEVQIAKICGGGTQTFTQPYEFITPSIVYCSASGTDESTEFISNVTVTYDTRYPIIDPATGDVITNMSNDSESSNYTSYVNELDKIITLYQGSQNNIISVAKSWRAGQENEGIVAWVDFNRDGIFTDDEMILKSNPSKDTPVEAQFSVPADAYVSLVPNKYVVMRVAMRRNGLPNACGIIQYGEVEDYKVMILKPDATNLVDPDAISIYPNPVTDVINITNVNDGDGFEIYTSAGRLAKKGKIVASKIDATNLVSGVYIIVINSAENGEAQIKFIKE